MFTPLISIKRFVAACALITCTTTVQEASSQPNRLSFQDLSAFQNPGKSWQIVGDVTAALDKENKFSTSSGTGVLVNMPRRKGAGKDLFTHFEHGDVDVELDYIMAKEGD